MKYLDTRLPSGIYHTIHKKKETYSLQDLTEIWDYISEETFSIKPGPCRNGHTQLFNYQESEYFEY
jgi:hypothetical protein